MVARCDGLPSNAFTIPRDETPLGARMMTSPTSQPLAPLRYPVRWTRWPRLPSPGHWCEKQFCDAIVLEWFCAARSRSPWRFTFCAERILLKRHWMAERALPLEIRLTPSAECEQLAWAVEGDATVRATNARK